jgi:hypothetical protein
VGKQGQRIRDITFVYYSSFIEKSKEKNPCGAEGEGKARFPQGRECAILLNRDYIGRNSAYFTFYNVVLNLLTAMKICQVLCLDFCVMDKYLFAAFVGGDKAISLLIAEPFYCTSTH